MFSRLREPFGKAGLIVACFALVMALVGGAFAATASHRHHKKKSTAPLNSKQKKEVEKIAKKLATAGPAGPQGPAGAQGDTGAAGTNGTNGTNGVSVTSAAASVGECPEGGTKFTSASGTSHVCNGAAGSDGETPLMISFTGEKTVGSVTCHEGGVEFEVEGKVTVACNGKEGKDGKEGSPWTMGGTLPAGATETGSYAAQGTQATSEFGLVAPISFPVQLASAGSATPLYEGKSGFSTHCSGGSAQAPTAAPGYLCLYPTEEFNTTFSAVYKVPAATFGVNASGAFVEFAKDTSATEAAYASGSFAITAPDPIVTGVSPDHGPAAGGTSVTATGQNLTSGKMHFGSAQATGCTVNSAGTEITCTSPAGAAGTVDVTVTVNGYISSTTEADHYTYE